MASVSITCRTTIKNKEGLSPVYLRMTHKGKSKFLSTKIYVNPEKDWDEQSGTVKRTYKNSARTNSFLKHLESKAHALALDIEDGKLSWNKLDLNLLDSRNKENELDFIQFMEQRMNRYFEREEFGNGKKYRVVVNKLKAFNNEGKLPFEDVNLAFLQSFETYLRKIGNGVNTIGINMKIIRATLYDAIKQGLFQQEKNPFFQYKLKSKKPDIKRLSLQDIEKLESLEFSPRDKWLFNTHQAFLFSMYCAGIRVGDLLELTGENIQQDNYLVYEMEKVGKPRVVKLTKPALQILERFPRSYKNEPLFPFLTIDIIWGDRLTLFRAKQSVAAMMNKTLKEIARIADIDKRLSMHQARHGFSELARQKGISVYDISKALGHSSLAITEKYLQDLDLDSQESAMKRLFEE